MASDKVFSDHLGASSTRVDFGKFQRFCNDRPRVGTIPTTAPLVEMTQLFVSVILVLAASGAFAQTGPDKTSPSAPSTGSIREPPPIGGASINPELRTKATKDIPMGDGKPKNSPAPAKERTEPRK